MNTVQRIAKNITVLTIADITCSAIGFLLIMYVAPYLGPEGFGILSFAFAFAGIFVVFTDIGLSILITREVARDKSLAKKYLGNIAALKTSLCIPTFVLIALTINLLGYSEQVTNTVYLIALSVIFTSFSTMFYSIFEAYERMEFIAIGRILNSVLLLGGALFVITQGLGITALASVYLLTSLTSLGYSSIVSTAKFGRPKVEIDLGFWKEALKQAWPFGLIAISVTIYNWIDSVMLSLMQGDEVVGWYNAAYRVVFGLALIPSVYLKSIFPVMSRSYVSSKESQKFVYEKSVKYMVILAVPIGVAITLLADKVIILIFGTEYSNSIIALQILIWSMVFIFISRVFGDLLHSSNRQIVIAKITGSCVLLNVLLNAILIPRYSYIGASIATVVTEFIALSLNSRWSWKIGYRIPTGKLRDVMVKVFIAGGIMCVFILYFEDLALWGLVPLSALVYFTVLWICGGIDREDTLLFRQVAGRQ